MKKKNIFLLLLSVILITNLSGCKDDDIYRSDNYTYLLCDHTWVEYYYTDGVRTEHILEYYLDGYGYERITYYRPNSTITEEYDFYWEWDIFDGQRSIYMEYADFVLNFDYVTVTPSRLRGYFDEYWVEFTPY